jgi:phosphate-selective porin OprO/OprP
MRVAILLLLALPLFGQTVEERLKTLEDQVTELKRENAQLRKDLGLEVVAQKVEAKPESKGPTVKVGGFLQVQGDAGDHGDARFSSSNARFFLRRARLNVGGRFTEDFDYRTEIELFGSLGEVSGLRGQLTDAYVTWNRYRAANIRVGQFKTPFGFEQLIADTALQPMERSMVNDRLTAGRQIGVQAAGHTSDDRFAYAAGIFNGSGTNISANDNDRFMQAARLSYVPFTGQLLDQKARWAAAINVLRSNDKGLSIPAEIGIGTTFTGQRHAEGIDSQFQVGQFELAAEALREEYEPSSASHRVRSSGSYLQAGYFVIPKLQLLGRYETFQPDTANEASTTKATLLGLNYLIRHNDLKLQLNWLHETVPGFTQRQDKWMARVQTVF